MVSKQKQLFLEYRPDSSNQSIPINKSDSSLKSTNNH